MGRNEGDVDRVRGQEQPVNISFVCRRYEGKGVAQMWAAARVQGQHESVRPFSVVNLPVTWLLSAGSACEWQMQMWAGGRRRQGGAGGAAHFCTHVNI